MNGDWDHDDLTRLEARMLNVEKEVYEMRGSAKTWQMFLLIILSTTLNIVASWVISHQESDSHETARVIQQFIERQEEQDRPRYKETNR